MTKREEIREGIVDIFSEDMLLCFWTHESCPPSKDLIDCLVESGWDKGKIPLDEAREKIKHPPCMECWEKWVDELVERVMQKLHSQGVVIQSQEAEFHHGYFPILEPLIKEV